MSKISYVQFKFIKPESEYSEKEYQSIKLKISKNIKYNLNEDASEIFNDHTLAIIIGEIAFAGVILFILNHYLFSNENLEIISYLLIALGIFTGCLITGISYIIYYIKSTIYYNKKKKDVLKSNSYVEYLYLRKYQN